MKAFLIVLMWIASSAVDTDSNRSANGLSGRGTTNGARVIPSTPPAITVVASPVTTWAVPSDVVVTSALLAAVTGPRAVMPPPSPLMKASCALDAPDATETATGETAAVRGGWCRGHSGWLRRRTQSMR